MASSRELEFILSMRDEATKVLQNFKETAVGTTAGVKQSFDEASGAVGRHSKEVSGLSQFIRENRTEQREHTFLFRQGAGVVGAASVGLSIFNNTLGQTNSEMKSVTTALNNGFISFQGLSFLLAGVAGPWGTVISLAGGLTAALFSMGSGAKDAEADLKKQNEELEKFIELAGKIHNLPKGNALVNKEFLEETRKSLEDHVAIIGKVVEATKGGEASIAEATNGVVLNIEKGVKGGIVLNATMLNDEQATIERVKTIKQIAAEIAGKSTDEILAIYNDYVSKLSATQSAIAGVDITPKISTDSLEGIRSHADSVRKELEKLDLSTDADRKRFAELQVELLGTQEKMKSLLQTIPGTSEFKAVADGIRAIQKEIITISLEADKQRELNGASSTFERIEIEKKYALEAIDKEEKILLASQTTAKGRTLASEEMGKKRELIEGQMAAKVEAEENRIRGIVLNSGAQIVKMQVDVDTQRKLSFATSAEERVKIEADAALKMLDIDAALILGQITDQQEYNAKFNELAARREQIIKNEGTNERTAILDDAESTWGAYKDIATNSLAEAFKEIAGLNPSLPNVDTGALNADLQSFQESSKRKNELADIDDEKTKKRLDGELQKYKDTLGKEGISQKEYELRIQQLHADSAQRQVDLAKGSADRRKAIEEGYAQNQRGILNSLGDIWKQFWLEIEREAIMRLARIAIAQSGLFGGGGGGEGSGSGGSGSGDLAGIGRMLGLAGGPLGGIVGGVLGSIVGGLFDYDHEGFHNQFTGEEYHNSAGGGSGSGVGGIIGGAIGYGFGGGFGGGGSGGGLGTDVIARGGYGMGHEGGTVYEDAVRKFHSGGIAKPLYLDAPPSKEFPILVRGGETIRTEKQEKEIQNIMKQWKTDPPKYHEGGAVNWTLPKYHEGGVASGPMKLPKFHEGGTTVTTDQSSTVTNTLHFHFDAHVPDVDWVVNSITSRLRETGLKVTDLLVDNRSSVVLKK